MMVNFRYGQISPDSSDWYHILHRKDSVFILKHGITNEKTAFAK